MPTTTASEKEHISTRRYVQNHRYFHKKEREAVSKLYRIMLTWKHPVGPGNIAVSCWGHTWTEAFKKAKKTIDEQVIVEITRRISQ